MVDACQYTFVQTQRMGNTKSEPWCALGTLGDTDVSAQVHPWLRANHTVSDVGNRRGLYVWGKRYMGTLYLPLNFVGNPKLFKKIKVLKN